MVESDSSVDSTAPSDSEAGGGGVEAGEGRGKGEGRTIHPAPIVQFDSTTR